MKFLNLTSKHSRLTQTTNKMTLEFIKKNIKIKIKDLLVFLSASVTDDLPKTKNVIITTNPVK